jgi:hypothetical protein
MTTNNQKKNFKPLKKYENIKDEGTRMSFKNDLNHSTTKKIPKENKKVRHKSLPTYELCGNTCFTVRKCIA